MQDRQDLDLERGLPLPEGHPSPGAFVAGPSKITVESRLTFDTVAFETALQELQTELREFISDHVSKFLSLHATLPPPNPSESHESFCQLRVNISSRSCTSNYHGGNDIWWIA